MIDKYKLLLILLPLAFLEMQCSKSGDAGTATPPVTPPIAALVFSGATASNAALQPSSVNYNVSSLPAIRLSFNNKVDRTSVSTAIALNTKTNAVVPVIYSYERGDSTVVITPTSPLESISRYVVNASTSLRSAQQGALGTAVSIRFATQIDSSRKFPLVSDDALLDIIQKQTFKYFYDFGHPVSGLAPERNTSAETVTSGGSGFGIMALITGISRNYITRTEGLTRMQKIIAFLKNTAQTVHGAYPHWLNGTTGAIIPFSTADNGADLVETSYLVQGLICARQYFSGSGDEATLRTDINTIVNRVEWDWFRQNNQDILYWHYSATGGFAINMKIQGWNECLITYVLAASSTTHGVPAAVYTNGWANNGGAGFINGNTYYGYTLPLGPDRGGPLFFEHYSFLGINPNGLSDTYANYVTQTKNHTLINYNYCKTNPNNYFGYSDSTWGLTASDIENGYAASSPANDLGVIAPTAAISSLPYTPVESMKALKFYYYTLGDKIFKDYGFVDAFSLKDQWFASSFLAIDQGPIIAMIENYRTQLLWNLFTSAPEVKAGMISLGFSAPYL